MEGSAARGPEVGAEFAGYRIDAIAGRGGMGVVYRATDLRLDRPVALKVISPELAEDPDFNRRFQKEAQLAASLDHPNVIPIHHAGSEDGVLYVTMRFVEGTDLRAMIATEGALGPRLAAAITGQVAAALDEAHAHGLVHRDVKPANVLIAGHPERTHAYLTDFGLTKVASSESGMTATGMIVGTIDYMAPEQVLDGARVDARTDIYALGALLYHTVTGEVPFPRSSDAAKIFAHGSDPVPDPCAVRPELTGAFSQVVARAMAKDPEDRYLSAGDLGRAARAAAEGQQLSRAEHSVAIGDAAPLEAMPVPPRNATEASAELAPTRPAGREPSEEPVAVAAGASATPPPAATPARRLPRPAIAGIAVVAVGALIGLLAVLGAFSGDEPVASDPTEPAEDALARVGHTVQPGGTQGVFRAIEDEGGQIVVIMSTREGDELSEVARTTAPGARARPEEKQSGAVRIDVTQEGESFSHNGGEGLLSIGDRYARYFGWSLRHGSIEFYE